MVDYQIAIKEGTEVGPLEKALMELQDNGLIDSYRRFKYVPNYYSVCAENYKFADKLKEIEGIESIVESPAVQGFKDAESGLQS
ncbi:MAG: hypothetical protein EPN86_01455 [Nanoarchaeota archaeon]|nr:MAG: hypothetical protein EPN86_01455 [Nanoarchaeota archaeon]